MPHPQSCQRETYQAANAPLPPDFIKQLPERFTKGGSIIHNARNQIRVYETDGQQINVKKFCIPPIINRILYSLGWRTPKAKTTFLNAKEITKRGFKTPKPFGYLIERKDGLIDFSYFVSEQVQGVTPIRQCNTNTKALIDALAEYTARLHQTGLLHKDYTPGNILYKEQNGKFNFMLVDINRFHIQDRPIGLWRAVNNLMQPFEDNESLQLFVDAYADRRGLNKWLCVRYILFLRYMRNAYNKAKRSLKKIPGARFFLNKPLGKQK